MTVSTRLGPDSCVTVIHTGTQGIGHQSLQGFSAMAKELDTGLWTQAPKTEEFS